MTKFLHIVRDKIQFSIIFCGRIGDNWSVKYGIIILIKSLLFSAYVVTGLIDKLNNYYWNKLKIEELGIGKATQPEFVSFEHFPHLSLCPFYYLLTTIILSSVFLFIIGIMLIIFFKEKKQSRYIAILFGILPTIFFTVSYIILTYWSFPEIEHVISIKNYYLLEVKLTFFDFLNGRNFIGSGFGVFLVCMIYSLYLSNRIKSYTINTIKTHNFKINNKLESPQKVVTISFLIFLLLLIISMVIGVFSSFNNTIYTGSSFRIIFLHCTGIFIMMPAYVSVAENMFLLIDFYVNQINEYSKGKNFSEFRSFLLENNGMFRLFKFREAIHKIIIDSLGIILIWIFCLIYYYFIGPPIIMSVIAIIILFFFVPLILSELIIKLNYDHIISKIKTIAEEINKKDNNIDNSVEELIYTYKKTTFKLIDFAKKPFLDIVIKVIISTIVTLILKYFGIT